MRKITRLPSIAFGIACAIAVGGCNLQPIYAGGSSGPVASAMRNIDIAPIDNQSGWLLRQALISRLGSPQATPKYRLEIQLDDKIEGFGIRNDDSITRERRTLRARYRLIAADKGQVLLDATAGSDAGIDITSSEYATIAAEQTALERLADSLADQITTRVALFIRDQEK